MGIPFLQTLPATVRALGALAFHGARAGRVIAPLPAAKGDAGAIEGEALAKELARRGLTAPKSAFAKTPAEAGAAAAAIGFPVVLKIVSPQFSHKTEVGGVKLNLKSSGEVESEAKALHDALRKIDPKAQIDGFLVQEMASGVEVILGARNDALYGPMILFGAGGILVELVKDVAFRLLPVTPEDARAMIAETKVSKLLAGYRGKPAADTDALVKAICGLSDFFLEHRHALADLEINPLIVGAAGQGVRAVDIRPVRA
jgi:acyl-CoA synthetase (NDP forming)